MACISSSVTVESYEDITVGKTTGLETDKPAYKRRHSSYVPRKPSVSDALKGEEGLLLKVRPPIMPLLQPHTNYSLG